MPAKSKIRWVVLLLAMVVVPASARFHLMKIVELFPGTAASPNAHYVVLQMFALGQNVVAEHQVVVFDGTGQPIETLTFTGNVSNGANQAKILLATPQAESFFGVSADLAMSASLLKAGGKVCFADTIDCVAWGAYSGSPTGVGTPFNAPVGLLSGRAAIRRLDIVGSPTSLDAGDDTDNSADDFVFGLPAPRNNMGVLGTVPGATCGNGVVEGLEQCDDGNQSSGDGCSSTCVVDENVSGLPATALSGDFNGDGRSDVLWRNGVNGANAIWLSANNATLQPIAAVTNVDWKVAGIGHFDADNRSDILWRNPSTGANVIWKSGKNSTPQAMARVGDLDWGIVGIGDFDGDGLSDVFWRHAGTGANTIWKAANAQTPQGVASVTNLDWHVVGTGDFNADGKWDVLWRNASTGANVIWLSAKNHTPQAMARVSNLGWKVVGTGDVDGDGRSDVVWRHDTSGANAIWRSANGATPLAMSGVVDLDWEVVQMGDYNGDARSDVFWRHAGNGGNVLWKSASSANQQGLVAVTALAWKVVPLGD